MKTAHNKLSLIFLCFISCNLAKAQRDTIQLNLKGKVHIERYRTNKLAYTIYKTEQGSSFFLPTKLMSFQKDNDTLQFLISTHSDSLNISLAETHTDYRSSFSSNVLKVWNRDRLFELDVDTQKTTQNLILSSNFTNHLVKDSTLGYVTLVHFGVRYIPFESTDFSCNIGIHDKNKNGKIELDKDLLVLSEDEYFITSESRKSTFLQKENFIRIGEEFLKLTWDSGYQIFIEKVQPNNKVEAVIDHKMENIKINDENLKNLVKKEGYTLINIWSVYCQPCIEIIPELNLLKEDVVGLCLKDDFDVVKRFGVQFKNYWIDKTQVRMLNAFGFPNYVIVDSQLNIIGSFKSGQKAIEAYKSYE